ncbi:hypothetical protein Pint_25490 [Pistacia integerrima]|uniref:Uncharacterized protein n=1 Tax=Pistacia integerrima TaxID=434235 RepID=A0ACC0YAZ9_9ROSI|nr:hypothetical protein Pint_25490 [Pistacia integerrima]
MALLSKNKLKFVDGTIEAPSSTDSLFSVWERCNTMVLSWLTHSLSPSITNSILWIDKAYDVWTDLHERFSQGDIFRISDLQEEIYSFKQGDKNVSDYFTELKILWDELMIFRPLPLCTCSTPCSCGIFNTFKTYRNNDYVIRFLKGLNDSFTVVRSQIMLMDPLPSINKVFSLVVQQERQLSLGGAKVFVNRSDRESAQFPSKSQQQFQHQSVQSSKYQQGRKYTQSSSGGDNRFCTYCGKPRHTIETCYKKHGYPPGYKPRNSTAHNVVATGENNNTEGLQIHSDMPSSNQEHSGSTISFTPQQYQQLLALLQPANSAQPSHTTNQVVSQPHQPTLIPHFSSTSGTHLALSCTSKSPLWMVDTGATDHITHSLSCFDTYKQIKPILVTLPNGSKITAQYAGTVCLNNQLILTDVLYLPEFSFNLISVTKLTSSINCCLIFQSSCCLI